MTIANRIKCGGALIENEERPKMNFTLSPTFFPYDFNFKAQWIEMKCHFLAHNNQLIVDQSINWHSLTLSLALPKNQAESIN